MEKSLLRHTIIENLYSPIRAAVDAQKTRGAIWDEKNKLKLLIGIRVPMWYLNALSFATGPNTALEAATDMGMPVIAATYMGLPITAGEHDEIVAVWWDPTMALDMPGVPVSYKTAWSQR